MKLNFFITLTLMVFTGATTYFIMSGSQEAITTPSSTLQSEASSETLPNSKASESKPTQPPPDIITTNQEGQKLVRVSTIEGVEANIEFQRNVRLLQEQRNFIRDIQIKIEQTQGASEKEELESMRDQAIEKLNENNNSMFEIYGFSLNRDYIQVVEQAEVYLQATPEEAKRLMEQ